MWTKISSMSVSDIVSEILKFPKGAKIIIYSPLIREKGTYADLLENLRNKGYVRAQIDGVLVRLDEEIELAKTKNTPLNLS